MIRLNCQRDISQLKTADEELIREYLLQGKIIVYPTDTLYGLGVDASNAAAVKNLYQLKGKKAPVSVLTASVPELKRSIRMSVLLEELIDEFLPGPLTIIAYSTYRFAPQLTGADNRVGFRVPGDQISRQLPRLLGQAITTTSVNPAGKPAAVSFAQVQEYFEEGIALMLDAGPLPPSRGSTVLDTTCSPYRLLREGEISRQDLQKYVN